MASLAPHVSASGMVAPPPESEIVTGKRIARWEGALLLAYYVAYTAYLVLQSTQHAALPAYSAVMLAFALPLTVLTLGVTVFSRAARRVAR